MSTPTSFSALESLFVNEGRQIPAGRTGRKSDADFANLMEFRAGMSHVPESSAAPQAAPSAAPVSGIADRLQARAMAGLAEMFNRDGAGDGPGMPLDLGLRTLRGVHALMADKAAVGARLPESGHVRMPRGIALPDSGKGIPLSAAQRRILARVTDPSRPQMSMPLRAPTQSARAPRAGAPVLPDVGTLAARFESGSEGIAAVGYDRNGGTSYGKYQIASRPGTMDMFLKFLKKEEPDMAARLYAAGPANTGGREGAMPRVWRELAAEAPERFEELQERFIHRSHYQPALTSLERLGYDTKAFSSAMREVVFSTAVQHGPAGAARIFGRAAERLGEAVFNRRGKEEDLIREVYAIRSGQFGASSSRIQAAARRRMAEEQELAVSLSRKTPARA